MYLYFNNNNLLADEQFRFRKKYLTEYAAIKLAERISNEMESGKTPVTLFINLSKAFDTLKFDILFQKLNYYGIAGRVGKKPVFICKVQAVGFYRF